MVGPYVHNIDPVLADVGGVHLWWYGLGFALGFLQIYLFLRRGHVDLTLSLREEPVHRGRRVGRRPPR